jgi:hypothetical protein
MARLNQAPRNPPSDRTVFALLQRLPCRTPVPRGRRSLNSRRRLTSRATTSVSRTRPAELSSSLVSLRFAAAPTRSRLASARICKWAHLAPCQNINDQRSRNEIDRGFEECRRARRHRAPSRPRSHDNGPPWERHPSPSNGLGRCRRSLCARISDMGRAPGTILSFRNHHVLGRGIQHRKPAIGNLEE